MTSLTVFIFIIFSIALIIFGIISVALFYHIGRYSHLGDASKRVFSIYFFCGALIAFIAFILLILNHIFS